MAATVTSLAVHNAGDQAATASISPASGGILFAGFNVNGRTSDVTSIGGTLSGTWHKIGSTAPASGANEMASLWWCGDYGASGTVAPTYSGSPTYAAIAVFSVVDGTLIDQTTGIAQSKTANGTSATDTTCTLDTAPAHCTVAVLSAINHSMTNVGTLNGCTNLVNDNSFTSIVVWYKATGSQTMDCTQSSAGSFAIVQAEVAYLKSSAHSFRLGWRR